MKYLIFILFIGIASCKKADLVVKQQGGKQVCGFSFPLEPNAGKRKPQNPPNGNPNPQGKPVILLDFDGHNIQNTSWNWNGDILCDGSGLTTEQMAEVMAKVADAYSMYDVLVTTNESAYYSAPPNRRTRIIFTTTWEPFGMAGGMAFLNSFTFTDGTPCLVFTSLLNYNTKFIKEAAAHEVGHTLNLYHQSVCSEGLLINQYNMGGNGVAPIMGNGYYQPITIFIEGTNSNCEIQNDHSVINQILNLK